MSLWNKHLSNFTNLPVTLLQLVVSCHCHLFRETDSSHYCILTSIFICHDRTSHHETGPRICFDPVCLTGADPIIPSLQQEQITHLLPWQWWWRRDSFSEYSQWGHQTKEDNALIAIKCIPVWNRYSVRRKQAACGEHIKAPSIR